MRKELYINDQLADIGDVSIPLNFACSEISDLDGISGNYSLTIKLPLSKVNINIAKFAEKPNTSPGFLWSGYKAEASYFVNGVPIFQKQQARLLSSENEISINVQFGNLEWIKNIEGVKLKDITSLPVLDWNYWVYDNETTEVKWVLTDYGNTFENVGLHVDRLHPAVNVHYLWGLIWDYIATFQDELSAFTTIKAIVEEDLWMPIMTQIANPLLPFSAAFSKVDADIILIPNKDTNTSTVKIFPLCTNTSPNPGSVFLDALGVQKFTVPRTGDYNITLLSNLLNTVDPLAVSLADTLNVDIHLVHSNEDDNTSIWSVEYTSEDIKVSPHEINVSEVVSLSKGDTVYLEVTTAFYMLAYVDRVVSLEKNAALFTIELVQDATKKEQLEFMMPYDVNYNLPDWDLLTFIKIVMQFYGLLLENQNTGVDLNPVFFNISDLQKSDAVDWSDKLVNFDRPKIEWNLGLKEKNYLRYEADEEFGDAYFTSYQTDGDSKDLFVSKFAATADSIVLFNKGVPPFVYAFQSIETCSMRQFKTDPVDGTKFDGKCKARIFRVYTYSGDEASLPVIAKFGETYDITVTTTGRLFSYFNTIPDGVVDDGQGLSMQNIGDKYYGGYISAVKSNRIFTFLFTLNEVDINRFIHARFVYIQNFPGFYLVKKILNYVAGTPTKVELLLINEYDLTTFVADETLAGGGSGSGGGSSGGGSAPLSHDRLHEVTNPLDHTPVVAGDFGKYLKAGHVTGSWMLVSATVIPFTSTATPTVSDYNTNYADIYGQYPVIECWLVDGDTRTLLIQPPIITLVTDLIDTILFDLGFENTGFIIIR